MTTSVTEKNLQEYLQQNKYAQIIYICEQAIDADPSQVIYYWYLGLALLLQEREEEAQLIWMNAILEIDPDQAEQFTSDLLKILYTEAARQEQQENLQSAWLIRQHIREFDPENLDNLLAIVRLAIDCNTFVPDDPIIAEINEILLHSDQSQKKDQLVPIVVKILNFNLSNPEIVRLVEYTAAYVSNFKRYLEILLDKAGELYSKSKTNYAAKIGKICIKFAPDNLQVLEIVIPYLQSADYETNRESIALAQKCFDESTDVMGKFIATYNLITGLMGEVDQWEKAIEIYQIYKSLLLSLQTTDFNNSITQEEQEKFKKLVSYGSYFLYFEDNPQRNRPLRNYLANLGQKELTKQFQENVNRYQQSFTQRYSQSSAKPLKIGYLSECFRFHSIGWLVRWLLQYHDREKFEIHLYSSRESDDALQNSFIHDFGDNFHQVNFGINEIAEKIFQDEIDILIELDSLTSLVNCSTIALKPAPIQVHWLGYDASGIPTVDYFIADPYVLPENADHYYHEKIWRLPNCYIAVDGFEISIPTLRRDHLDIPNDAVIYLSSQTGFKLHPDHIRSQLKILKAVPNSYFLVKSLNAEHDTLINLLTKMAEEEGVNTNRIKPFPKTMTEAMHRANLGIADVVLDTYPYNGATTTLETLWMGIPLVTRVGEQFAARNSYTMMINAGITEGIAWSDEEYIEWGIRLGEDAKLRQEISWKLKKSRQTSPLWNGEAFAREMEKAYTQMWQNYLDSY